MQLDRNTRLKKSALIFPSGLSVRDAIANARFDVTAGNFATINQALNHIAQNELGKSWQESLQLLASQRPTHQQYYVAKQTAQPELPWKKKQSPKLAKTIAEQQLQRALTPTCSTKIKLKKIQLISRVAPTSLANLPKLISLADIYHLLIQHPNLALSGMLPNGWQQKAKPSQKQSYQKQRDALLTAVTGCNLAAYVLSQCQKTKTANRNWQIDKLTQATQHYLNANQNKPNESARLHVGEVLCAALFLGFKLTLSKQQIFLNISSRSQPLKQWKTNP